MKREEIKSETIMGLTSFLLKTVKIFNVFEYNINKNG